MNRQKARELLPIMEAYSEGLSIQFRDYSNDMWRDDPSFNPFKYPGVEYRIKPTVVEEKIAMCVDDFECCAVYVRKSKLGLNYLVTCFDYPSSISFNGEHIPLEDCLDRNYEWSADRENWSDFSKK